MTHQNDYTFEDGIGKKRFDVIAELMRVLINNAMQVERSKYLQAEQYGRAEDRKEYAKGFKLKT